MGEITRFPTEMQPARPYPPHMNEFAPAPFEAVPVDDALTRLEAFNTIYELSKRYSAARVTRWVKSAASILGQEIT